MPANKNAMTRYALIDGMLSNRYRAYSIQDITECLKEKLPEYGLSPVSKRCVEKDLAYLEYDSPFGVELEEYWVDAADKNDRVYRKRCIRYSDPTFSIFKPKLSEEEKNILRIALDTLGGFDGLENFNWLRDLKYKLNIVNRAPVVSWSKNLLDDSTLFGRLFTAINLHLVIKLEYFTFLDKEKLKTVSITPHLLKEYNTRWFLIGSAADTEKLLTFPLDRIVDFILDYIHTPIPSPSDLAERYEEIIGITYKEENPLLEIIFWVSDDSQGYIETKPIHGSQTPVRGTSEEKLRKENKSLNFGRFFKIECRENYELIRELSAFGPDLIVISPTDIQEKVVMRLNSMVKRYQSLCDSQDTAKDLE